jgi:hypothetical protein
MVLVCGDLRTVCLIGCQMHKRPPFPQLGVLGPSACPVVGSSSSSSAAKSSGCPIVGESGVNPLNNMPRGDDGGAVGAASELGRERIVSSIPRAASEDPPKHQVAVCPHAATCDQPICMLCLTALCFSRRGPRKRSGCILRSKCFTMR